MKRNMTQHTSVRSFAKLEANFERNVKKVNEEYLKSRIGTPEGTAKYIIFIIDKNDFEKKTDLYEKICCARKNLTDHFAMQILHNCDNIIYAHGIQKQLEELEKWPKKVEVLQAYMRILANNIITYGLKQEPIFSKKEQEVMKDALVILERKDALDLLLNIPEVAVDQERKEYLVACMMYSNYSDHILFAHHNLVKEVQYIKTILELLESGILGSNTSTKTDVLKKRLRKLGDDIIEYGSEKDPVYSKEDVQIKTKAWKIVGIKKSDEGVVYA